MSIQQVKSNDWILEDVLTGSWNKTYKIDQNSPFSFSISDCSMLTQFIRRSIKSNDQFAKLYAENLPFVQRQGQSKIWVNLDHQIIQMTLLDVYQCFIKYLKDRTFEDQLFNVNEVSFIGPTGPFTDMTLINCLNDRLISQFVFNGIITNKLPARKYRVKTQGQLKVEFGQNMDLSTKLDLRQITDTGLLFSTKDDLVIQEFSKSDYIKFFIDTRGLKQFVSNGLRSENEKQDIFYSENQLRYFFIEEHQIQKNLGHRSYDTNEYFLFCRYRHMLESDIPHIFMEFTDTLDDYFKYLISA